MRQRLAKATLDSTTVVNFALQFANALAGAHEKGIIHRDLKPENLFIIMMGRESLFSRFVIINFGASIEMEQGSNN